MSEGAEPTTREVNSYLRVAGVSKRFRTSTVLDEFDLAVARGEFVSLLGPSGCGKTTLLRVVAGLLRADCGRVVLDGRDLTRLPAHRRNVGVVFQNYALFPHLTVSENVAFGLKAKGLRRADIRTSVADALALVRLEDLSDRAISALSGGQQQRVAVARAIVVKPALLLLDEPFSALDRKLRETMQIEMRALLRQLGITCIFVTHDQEEALILSDRIAVMNLGRIEQLADPNTIYGRPTTPYVLDFVGMSTRFEGQVVATDGRHLEIDTAVGTLRANGDAARGARVLVAVRPEKMEFGPQDDQFNGVSLTLREVVFMGAKTLLHFHAEEQDQAIAEVTQVPADLLRSGADVDVRWPVEATLVYAREPQ